MTETFADAVERLRDVLDAQVSGWKRLLESTRAANRAVRVQDGEEFERVLAEQVETLRELREIERRRAATVREVGPQALDGELAGAQAELRELAAEVSRSAQIGRIAVERNAEMVDARLALHRRAGRQLPESAARVDRTA